MAGILHNITSRRTFTFSNTALSSTIEIPLVRALDTLSAKSLDLIVRVHSVTIGSGASILVKAYAISLTSEEPDTDFINSTAVATVTLNNSTTAPSLSLGSLSTPFGHMVRITISGTQAGSSQTITATLSIDLLERDN